VSPVVGFASLLAKEEGDLLKRQESIANTRSEVMLLIKQYNQHYRPNKPSVEQLMGLDDTRSRIEELASDCKSEIMAFAPGGSQKPEVMAASRQPDLDILRRDLVGGSAAVLAYLTGHSVAGSALAGGSAATGTISLLNKVIGL
jgi:hypothetical protein